MTEVISPAEMLAHADKLDAEAEAQWRAGHWGASDVSSVCADNLRQRAKDTQAAHLWKALAKKYRAQLAEGRRRFDNLGAE